MPSVIRQLTDDDLEAVHHMIRRRAVTQVEIGREIERRLGRPIAGGDAARQRMVSRYSLSADYRKWLARWQAQEPGLRKAVESSRQKYEFLTTLLQDAQSAGGATGAAAGFDLASRAVQARLLAQAMEMTDEELMAAMGAKGPIASLIRLAQNERLLALREEVGRKASAAGDVAADASKSPAERRAAIRAIFGSESEEGGK